jgi:cytochrome c556
MKRWAWVAGVLGLLGVAGLIGAQGNRTPSVKEVMGKLHKGANSPLTTVRADLQAKPPDWAEIQQAAKDFVTYWTALGKNNPPKGDKQSWAQLTSKYLENARALEAAAQKKDPKAALTAHTRLNDSCKSCHNAHRPN